MSTAQMALTFGIGVLLSYLAGIITICIVMGPALDAAKDRAHMLADALAWFVKRAKQLEAQVHAPMRSEISSALNDAAIALLEFEKAENQED